MHSGITLNLKGTTKVNLSYLNLFYRQDNHFILIFFQKMKIYFHFLHGQKIMIEILVSGQNIGQYCLSSLSNDSDIMQLEIKPCELGFRNQDMEAKSYNFSYLLVNI